MSINTYYHIKIFKSKMPCSQQHSANLGCANGQKKGLIVSSVQIGHIPSTQKIQSV